MSDRGGLVRLERCGKLRDVGGREVPVPVVQPHADGPAGNGKADDDVEIPIGIDIGGANRDSILCGLEGDAAGSLPRHRELDAIRVAVRVPPDMVRDGNVRLAVRIEVSDDRGEAEWSGSIPQSEYSRARRRRFDQRSA